MDDNLNVLSLFLSSSKKRERERKEKRVVQKLRFCDSATNTLKCYEKMDNKIFEFQRWNQKFLGQI